MGVMQMNRSFLPALCLAFVLGHPLAAVALAQATTDATAQSGYQEAVRSQMQELVRSAIVDFFKQNGRDVPGQIDVKSRADFDLTKSEPRLRELALDVSMTSDQPAAVLREARQRIMRTLRGNGFRFEAASTPAEALMPQVKLNLEVVGVERPEQVNGVREYAILAALCAGFIAFAVVAILVVLQPLRRRRRPSGAKPETSAQTSDEPLPGKSLAGSGPRPEWPVVGLPPLPRESMLVQGDAGGLPPLHAAASGLDVAQADLELV
jgi:hypothetical protein